MRGMEVVGDFFYILVHIGLFSYMQVSFDLLICDLTHSSATWVRFASLV